MGAAPALGLKMHAFHRLQGARAMFCSLESRQLRRWLEGRNTVGPSSHLPEDQAVDQVIYQCAVPSFLSADACRANGNWLT